jgi:glycosyltransferase involved in cell wall biosynthesis
MSVLGVGSQLVSVIVPAYQAEAYLEEALESVLEQDHLEVEVVVVDDGSTDRTAEIALAHGVRALRQPNTGPAAARNAGLAVAQGAFVAILDADDVWPTDRLSRQVTHLLEHPELGIVLGLTEVFLTPGQPPPAHDPRFAPGEQVIGHPSTMLARREVFELVGGFDESLRLSEDIDWLARASDAGVRAGRLEHTLLRYRVHAANTSRDTRANHAATLGVLRASVARKRSGVGA